MKGIEGGFHCVFDLGQIGIVYLEQASLPDAQQRIHLRIGEIHAPVTRHQ